MFFGWEMYYRLMVEHEVFYYNDKQLIVDENEVMFYVDVIVIQY